MPSLDDWVGSAKLGRSGTDAQLDRRSDDEAKFLKDFIANLEKEDAGSKAHA